MKPSERIRIIADSIEQTGDPILNYLRSDVDAIIKYLDEQAERRKD